MVFGVKATTAQPAEQEWTVNDMRLIDADGMCPNCEYCAKNDFKYRVKKVQDCVMWED
jgi:hypothetical protein